jgi:hypothetical protein
LAAPVVSIGSTKTNNSKYKTDFSGKQQTNPIDWHNFDSSWNTLNANTSLVATSVTENKYAGIQSSISINTDGRFSRIA